MGNSFTVHGLAFYTYFEALLFRVLCSQENSAYENGQTYFVPRFYYKYSTNVVMAKSKEPKSLQ
jgi:hypothetical protein